MAWHVLFEAQASEPKYPVSAIPEELKLDVNAVIREDQMVFKIISKNSASLWVHYVVTILNDKGNGYAKQIVSYNKLQKITDFNASVYDAMGKQIKRLKNNEINDQSSFDGFSLYSDQRLKSVNLVQAIYPYTVEFEYEVKYNYLYSIPGSVISGEKISIQHASYQLIYPSELAPRYKVLNIENNPIKQKLGDSVESISWSFENLKPVKLEPNGPHYSEVLPQIIAAPTTFEYDGYGGSMISWKEYGKWNAILNKDKDQLPEATKQKVKELTKELKSIEQKTRVLYEYLQSKTRYVSIQLGIGGLQPFPANVVDETGYGDCKALSNYMVAMLKEAGVKGYYTTIRAGENEPDVIIDFPSHQSNHVIVSIPNDKDTLWLECTSQTKPFGYMGSFTGDRIALMITEEGGKIVRTPAYPAEQNLQTRSANVSIDAAGNAKAVIKTTYMGLQYENGGLSELLGDQFDDQRKWVQDNTDIPSFTINSFSIKGKKEKLPSALVKLDLTLNRYASVSGKRLFITPNLMNKTSFIPTKVLDRKTEVVRLSNYLDLDTVMLNFPENLYPEFLPEPVKLSSRFGEYEVNYQFNEGKLIYTRKMKVWKGRFAKETYNELIDFYKTINKADNVKLVLLNKT